MLRPMWFRTAALAIGMTVPLAAPASAAPVGFPEPAWISVHNELGSPVRLYVEHGDVDLRLGSIGAGAVGIFQIPGWMIADREQVDVYVRPQRGVPQSTGWLTVRPGENLDVIVPQMGKPHTAAAPSTPAPTGTATVTVQNNRDEPVRVYVEHSAFDLKLGTVSAGATQTFDLPSWMIPDEGGVEIHVRTPKGQETATGPLTLHRGERLGVEVPRG